jgi:hypothetical protein
MDDSLKTMLTFLAIVLSLDTGLLIFIALKLALIHKIVNDRISAD